MSLLAIYFWFVRLTYFVLTDFRRRFLSLLSFQFSKFSSTLALNILQNKNAKDNNVAGTNPHLPPTCCRCVCVCWLKINLHLSLFFQFLPVQNSQPLSLHMTWSVWRCIPETWWTITSSWTWFLLLHACTSLNNSVTSHFQWLRA